MADPKENKEVKPAPAARVSTAKGGTSNMVNICVIAGTVLLIATMFLQMVAMKALFVPPFMQK